VISLNYNKVHISSDELDIAADELLNVGKQKPEPTGNSQVLKQYVECMQKMQELMEAYCELLNCDSQRIKSAARNMLLAEESLLNGY